MLVTQGSNRAYIQIGSTLPNLVDEELIVSIRGAEMQNTLI